MYCSSRPLLRPRRPPSPSRSDPLPGRARREEEPRPGHLPPTRRDAAGDGAEGRRHAMKPPDVVILGPMIVNEDYVRIFLDHIIIYYCCHFHEEIRGFGALFVGHSYLLFFQTKSVCKNGCNNCPHLSTFFVDISLSFAII